MTNTRTGAMPDTRTGVMPNARTGVMPDTRAENISGARAEVMPDARAGNMPDTRADVMTEAGAEVMPDSRTEVKLDVRVYPIDKPKGNTRAFASVAVNDLVAIRGIRVVQNDKGLFVALPQSYDKKERKFHDIAFPLDGELRKDITRAVLGEHNKQRNLPSEERGYPPPDKDAAPIEINLDEVKLDVRVYPIEEPQGNVLAFASISVDDLIAIRGVRIVEGEEGLFISMPNTQDKYLNYHDVAFPLTRELRDEMTRTAVEKLEAPEITAERKVSLGSKLAAGAEKAANHTAPDRAVAKSRHAGVLE